MKATAAGERVPRCNSKAHDSSTQRDTLAGCFFPGLVVTVLNANRRMRNVWEWSVWTEYGGQLGRVKIRLGVLEGDKKGRREGERRSWQWQTTENILCMC